MPNQYNLKRSRYTPVGADTGLSDFKRMTAHTTKASGGMVSRLQNQHSGWEVSEKNHKILATFFHLCHLQY